jgi:predicted aspartyl protease
LTYHHTTGADGTTPPFNVALREKTVQHTGLDVAPSVTVTATTASGPFATKTITLDLTV